MSDPERIQLTLHERELILKYVIRSSDSSEPLAAGHPAKPSRGSR